MKMMLSENRRRCRNPACLSALIFERGRKILPGVHRPAAGLFGGRGEPAHPHLARDCELLMTQSRPHTLQSAGLAVLIDWNRPSPVTMRAHVWLEAFHQNAVSPSVRAAT